MPEYETNREEIASGQGSGRGKGWTGSGKGALNKGVLFFIFGEGALAELEVIYVFGVLLLKSLLCWLV